MFAENIAVTDRHGKHERLEAKRFVSLANGKESRRALLADRATEVEIANDELVRLLDLNVMNAVGLFDEPLGSALKSIDITNGDRDLRVGGKNLPQFVDVAIPR
ncbi:MAG: hypothetical protein R3B96_18430 [Pirellulaceae bacterium]